MPVAETAIPTLAPTLVRLEVRSSLLMELVWALCIKPAEAEDEFPARVRRFAAEPGLEERIRTFWGDAETCFTEALVVAERGEVLFETDPQRFWTGLAKGAVAPPRFEPLTSETPDDRALFRNRLARLHDDPATRAGWLELLRQVWTAVEDEWNEAGRDAAESRAWELRTKLPEMGSYADLMSVVQGCDFDGALPRLVAESALAGRPVILMPAWFGRNGYLVALTSCLVWGPPNPTRPPGPSEATRDRARRHKALGDPTRLSIFEATARRPRTVGELARELGVAQPTVSNHVRILRDAGLVDQEKGGGRRLVADVANFERFVDESRRAVLRPGGPITPLA
jgi:DNA-binding transcriptional ArsR family regulator